MYVFSNSYVPNRVEILVTVSSALVTSSDTFLAVFLASSAFPRACNKQVNESMMYTTDL